MEFDSFFWLHEASNDASRSDSVVVGKPVKFTELWALDLCRSLHEAMGSMAASSLHCNNTFHDFVMITLISTSEHAQIKRK